MPEIAEVETLRRALQPLVGERIVEVRVVDPKLADDLDSALVSRDVVDHPVSEVRRHGKLLGVVVGHQVLELHLRMTGSLQSGVSPKARAVLRTSAPAPLSSLSFVDPRRFGTLRLRPEEQYASDLAPDLLLADEDALLRAATRAAGLRAPVKALLLDQNKVVAGIGNYLADETIAQVVGVDPAQPSSSLTVETWLLVLTAAHQVARMAVDLGGVSVRDYVHLDGGRGSMQEHLLAYGRAGEPCWRCGRRLARTRVAGRGTTYCPYCAAQTT